MLSYWQTESDNFLTCFDKQNLHVSFALSTFRFSDFVELLFPVLQAFLGQNRNGRWRETKQWMHWLEGDKKRKRKTAKNNPVSQLSPVERVKMMRSTGKCYKCQDIKELTEPSVFSVLHERGSSRFTILMPLWEGYPTRFRNYLAKVVLAVDICIVCVPTFDDFFCYVRYKFHDFWKSSRGPASWKIECSWKTKGIARN